MPDDLDGAIEEIRSGASAKRDYSQLWAELDRDNEIRREYRARGLEPPTTWDAPSGVSLPRAPPPPPGLVRRVTRKAAAIYDGIIRALAALIRWSLIAGAICIAWSYVYEWQYGSLSPSRYESFDVGVWITPPTGDAVYLGITRGAAACGRTAWGYAFEKGYGSSDRWSYACCTHRNGSTCYEKIR